LQRKLLMNTLVIKETYQIIDRLTCGELVRILKENKGDIHCMGSKMFVDVNNGEYNVNEFYNSWDWIQCQNSNKKYIIVNRNCETDTYLT